ncbi:MAG TPA: amino acid adenylation domain-containing protein [Longimicrobium sp.]
MELRDMQMEDRENDVAVVGMSCRFPGAADPAAFWENLRGGVESIRFFSDEELREVGIGPRTLADPAFVKAYGTLDDAYAFDAPFFGVTNREAQALDPQHRVFLECAWSALEDAGCDPARFRGAIGVYAGSGFSRHVQRVMADEELMAAVGSTLAVHANDKDFLATRVSYKLGLRGPSVVIQTACSTSLVAIHVACQSLLNRECDVALAGGATIAVDQAGGYRYQEGGILSPDGHCRAFDAKAAGTIGGSGAGVVVLKRFADAVRDGDVIHAVVKGSAINNDGAGKIGFTAPSVEGQSRAIAEALALAGVDAADVSYVETHGTGTPLGDPIEIAALTEVFGGAGGEPFCALGAVKTNVGHLDTAAGVAGFIKTVLALKHRALPPTLHFRSANPETGLDGSPFYVNAALRPWESDGPRRAGVSSFGIGGTNAHVVLEEAPRTARAESTESPQLLVLSAKTETALERVRAGLAAHLEQNPDQPLADIAFTLQEGRAAHRYRWAAAARDGDEARSALAGTAARAPSSRRAPAASPSVAFLFPGQGTQYAGMARELYAAEPVFRDEMDRCARALTAELGLDLRGVLFPAEGGEDEANALLQETRLTQPALFAVEYSLAKLWMSWGVQPAAMLGHSIGEYVAACIAGVFSPECALRLVAARGRMMQSLPAGSMLAVPLPECEVRPLLPAGVSLAAVNSAAHCVVSGDSARVDEVEALLAGRDVAARRLHTSHAFHSASMDPILDAFAAEVRRARPAAPSIAFLSNVTGDWITAAEATDPDYWVRHLRGTVRFADGVGRLLDDPARVLLEVGPGETLGTFARRSERNDGTRVVVRTLPRAGQAEASDLTALEAAGALWTAGVSVDWTAMRRGEARRVQLPTYPFERQVHRVAPQRRAAAPAPDFVAAPAAVQAPSIVLSVEPQPDPTVVTDSLQAPDRLSRMAGRVTELFAKLVGTEPSRLRGDSSFLELGADSLLLMQLSRNVESTFGVRVPFRRLLEGMSTIGELSAHLVAEVPAEQDPDPAPAPAAAPVPASVVALTPIPVANGNGHTNGHVNGHANGVASAPVAGDVSGVIAQQMAMMQAHAALMQQQLALLGGGMVSNLAPAAPVQAVTAAAPAPAGPAPVQSAAPAAPVNRVQAAAAEEPATHGPHVPISATLGKGGGYTEQQQRHFEQIVERYTARTRKSKAYAQESRPALSDNRASLNFRMASKELLYPVVGDRSQGSRLWDVDGNEYVDFTIGFGVHFFGHRPPFIMKAVEEQLAKGCHTGPQSDLAGPTATLFRKLTGMERVTFCNTGSEAVMTALRIARTVTGREKIVLFEGSYHGCFDGILARPGAGASRTHSRPVAPGTTQGMIDDVVVLPYGPEAMEYLRANARDLAAVLVEPVRTRDPENQPREFLHELRALCDQTGTALIFDEMITGLRLQTRGAQGFFGVDADMATYGKVIGGGFPLGIVAGKAAYMDAIDGGMWQFGDDSFPAADQTFFAGTFCKHPVVLAAANAVLRHLQAQGPALYEELHARAARLVAGLRAVLEEEQVPVRILHTASLFRFVFRPEDPYVDLLFYHMLERGIYVWEGRGCFVSPAHTDQDCDRMVQALRESIHALREGGFLPEIDGPSGGPGGGSAANLPADLKLVPAASSGSTSSGSASTASSSSTEGPRAVPLTPAQRQVWVHAQLGDDASRAYNEQFIVGVRGALDQAALRAAVGDLARHHEALRTVFDPSGEVQHVFAAAPDPLPVFVHQSTAADGGEAGLREALGRGVAEVFDLAAGPLFRVHVHPAGADRQVLQFVVHHVVADGLATHILQRDLETAYGARCQGRAPELARAMQFSEYTALLAADAREHAAYEGEWLARFGGAVPLALPTDHARPRFPTSQAAVARHTLDAELSLRLRALSRQQGCTLFMTLLGGLLATLHRTAGQDDLVVGISSAGRPFPGADSLVGHCVDVLPIRSRVADGTRGGEFLRGVRDSLLDAYEHEAFSYARLHEALQIPRGPGVPPLISVTFNLEPGGGAGDGEPRTFAGLPVEPVRGVSAAFTKFDLTIDAVDTGTAIDLVFLFNTGLFERPTVQRLAAHLQRVLEQLAGDAELRLADLALIGAEERRMVVDEWNRTEAAYPAELCIHQLFQAQAQGAPHAVAVTFGDASLTFGELDDRANRLANHLVRMGVGPEVRVGICLERGLEMMVCILGVMKAGGAYVPVDPSHPAERIGYVLEDSDVAVVLTQARLRDGLAVRDDVRVIAVDAGWERIASESAAAPETGVTSENLAYVIYTSGSTGRPKGVAMHHRGVINYIDWGIRAYGADRGNGSPVFSSMAVDLTITNLLPLFAGLPVRLLPEENAVEALAAALREKNGFGAIKITPVHLSLLTPLLTAEEARDAAHTLVIGADFLSAEPTVFWQDNAPGVRLMNEYGPTETVVGCSAYELPNGLHRNGAVPVGGPIQNITFYVLDGRMQPVPVGVPGELYIGGVGVARGYLGRPALSAEKFVPNPFAGGGARMYRTGDRARWLEGGNLTVLGRTDSQVKVRGYRVELGEIEAVLRRHESVSGAIVVVREDVPGDPRLVAYVVSDADPAELRAYLRQGLPEHMVPAAFVPLAALPRTATGKIDPKTLPAPEYGGAEERYAAPRTPAERALAEIWAEVLRLERVGATDDFFELGGNSLLATRVVSRIRQALGVELTVRALFESPTVARLAACVGAPRGTERAQLPPVVAVERAGDLPLSFGQERLWFLQRLQPESPFYNVACAVRLRGALDARALERALGEIVRRHEPLRTRFRDAEGVPAQVIAPFHGFELPVDDLSALPGEARDAELRRRAQADAETPFDLARGPLFRARLLALGDEDNALLLCMHHAVCDGWSVGIFFRELSALYVAFRDGVAAELDDLPVQYADFAAWQRRHLVGEALDGQLAWWKERLAGAPALLELPTDLPRPAVQTYRGAHEPVELSGALLERLETLGRAEGASLFMVLLGAFQLLLARYAGVEDVVVGSPVAGRTRSEVEGLIGFFVNTLVLRTDLSGDPSFRALLARVREATLGAFEHQDVPFERLVEELQPGRSLSHTPLVQVSFVLQNLDPAGDGLPGLRTERVGAGLDVAKFDLTLTLTPGEDGLRGTLEYGTDLFEAGTARRMVRHLERVLEQVADDPDRRLSTLELADQLERVRMKGWNRTGAPYPAERCIHQLFQAQAERTPHAVAVTFESASLTFGELDERANRLANHLVRLGVGPEVRVGICLERSLEMMVCILGVMKAGGAYVPVDPSHPAERIGYVLEDAGVAVVLTQARLADAVPAPADARVVCVDAAWERIATESAAAPETGVTSENLCYVIYTSGSTGRPKGVAMHHRGVINYIDWGIRAYGADQGNGSPVFSSMAVDLTITNLLPLFAGLPVRLLPEENAVEALAAALREKNGFGAIKITPVHLSLLTPLLTAEEARDAAHTLVIGADFLSAEPTVFWQDNAPGVRLMNEYGPTETVVGCSAYTLPNGVHRNGPVPVGGPIQNITFHVLDAHGQPVPLGLPGELYIGGVGVARGYLGRPALTAEKFVPDPFAGGGARMYRTGDRARWLEGGNLTILGRTDHQVKVRGYRVEPGEVEAALRRHPSVSGAIVVVREDVPGDRRLVAYVAGDADADALREHLRQSLPEYMVPSAFVTMQALPRTATGKIDPKTLPAPEYGAARATYVAPRTEVEHALAEIWAEVLHVERVGATDDFFALGGHSLLLMRMAARLQAVFGLEVSIRTVFALPTLEALAAEVERRIYEDILAMSETEAEQLSELEPAMGD